MAKRTTKFIWTEQCQRKALLLDALVWAVSALMLKRGSLPRIRLL